MSLGGWEGGELFRNMINELARCGNESKFEEGLLELVWEEDSVGISVVIGVGTGGRGSGSGIDCHALTI